MKLWWKSLIFLEIDWPGVDFLAGSSGMVCGKFEKTGEWGVPEASFISAVSDLTLKFTENQIIIINSKSEF